MFQFPRWLLLRAYGFSTGYKDMTLVGCPIRVSPDQRLRAANRSFSQLTTPFFAS